MEEYWTNRGTKLREKCMKKNVDYQKLEKKYRTLLNILYFNFMSLCFLIFIINHFGLEKLLDNSIYYGCNTLNFVYFTVINCYEFVYCIYKVVLNNYVLISSLLFGFIGQRYLRIKRNFIVIALILFINVGNSLYKSL